MPGVDGRTRRVFPVGFPTGLLSTADVAQLRKVSRKTVFGWAKSGRLPIAATYLGRMYFRPDDAERVPFGGPTAQHRRSELDPDTDEELEAAIAAVLAKGLPDWWDAETRRVRGLLATQLAKGDA